MASKPNPTKLTDVQLLEVLGLEGVNLVRVKGAIDTFLQRGGVNYDVAIPIHQFARLKCSGRLVPVLETETVQRYEGRTNA